MKIYIGADHNGFEMKNRLIEELTKSGYDVVDKGGKEFDPDDDFPQSASRVITAMKASEDRDPRGILICGSGQGVCISANRYRGIRASLAWNLEGARDARNDSDSNVLCLSARYTSESQAIKLVHAWLTTPFAGAPRFKRRIRQMDRLG